MQQDVAGWEIGARDAIEHRCEGGVADLVRWLTQRGQRHRQQARVFDVIDPYEAHVLRDPVTKP
jgi:hypothetical protein